MNGAHIDRLLKIAIIYIAIVFMSVLATLFLFYITH